MNALRSAALVLINTVSDDAGLWTGTAKKEERFYKERM